MKIFGFIGVGNMGYPLLNATIKAFGREKVTFYDISKEQIDFIESNLAIKVKANLEEVVNSSKYIILSIKPQYYKEILREIKDILTDNHILISIAPGISITSIKEFTSNTIKVIRSMPNTPAMIGEGMTCISFSEDKYTKEEDEDIKRFFNAFGKYEILDEKLMDAAVCASGSSPAYVYMFIEALADSVVKYGMPRDKAYKLVAQTVLGSAKMVLETNEHPGVLKDKVCSPGGTTIEGVSALEKYGFRNSIIQATNACYDKTKKI